MKRISLIAKKVTTYVNSALRERKINRIIEAALDKAETNALEAEDEAEQILDSLGEVADNDTLINNKLNAFIKALEKAENWRNTKSKIETFKARLNEEVVVDNKQE